MNEKRKGLTSELSGEASLQELLGVAVQFVVQPSEYDQNIKRFPAELSEGNRKRFSYTWTRDELYFRYEGCEDESCNRTNLLEEWTYEGDQLPVADLKTHVNLWLVDGNPPSNGKEVEVILEEFEFTPLEEDGS
ncbi:MAG: hypothetical protein ACLFN7_01740 [Candidatus Acetothermia bacterium]